MDRPDVLKLAYDEGVRAAFSEKLSEDNHTGRRVAAGILGTPLGFIWPGFGGAVAGVGAGGGAGAWLGSRTRNPKAMLAGAGIGALLGGYGGYRALRIPDTPAETAGEKLKSGVGNIGEAIKQKYEDITD